MRSPWEGTHVVDPFIGPGDWLADLGLADEGLADDN
jgi:hypothetical protein